MTVQEAAKPNEVEARLSGWMARAQKGESEPYRNLLAELKSILERYIAATMRRAAPHMDASAAHDVVQEVLLAIHVKRHTYDPGQPLLPWVFAIASHKFVDWQRKHYRERRRLDLDFEVEALAAADHEPTTADDLEGLLAKLSPKQREVLELTKLEGLSVSEAAARTGLSESNVKVLTHRGFSALKKLIGGSTGRR